jgi:hypothetical protein
MDAQASLNEVKQKAYYPIFFGKLAAAGIHYRTPDEAEKLARLGAILYEQYEAGQAQAAEKQGSLLDLALERLTGDGPSLGGTLDKQAFACADQLLGGDPVLAQAAVAFLPHLTA